jgi:murein DD-endopeptidase MepM/ murein hydrolase activator NlpD
MKALMVPVAALLMVGMVHVLVAAEEPVDRKKAWPDATQGTFQIDYPYGIPVSYGEGRHPGIDVTLSRGTPIIAASDGDVLRVGDPCPLESYCGGIFVLVQHGRDFRSLYGHLEKAFVVQGQALKRGQLLGLSGVSNNGYAHLHFGLCMLEGSCLHHSQTYDPQAFWLHGEATCFDPNVDYAGSPQRNITLPVACGEYARRLLTERKQ